MNRIDKIKACRPHISSEKSKRTGYEEQFQNQVLRPILKFQNKLFIKLFLSNCNTHKINFKEFNSEKKRDYIESTFKKDFKIRASFIGTVIALFTIEEFEIYTENQKFYNKRIIQMIIERLKNQTV